MNKKSYQKDIEIILSHRYDNGDDLWTTEDKKLLKGAPFTTLESVNFLLELGVSPEDEIMKRVATLILSVYKEDGRFKISPSGGIYPVILHLLYKHFVIWDILKTKEFRTHFNTF